MKLEDKTVVPELLRIGFTPEQLVLIEKYEPFVDKLNTYILNYNGLEQFPLMKTDDPNSSYKKETRTIYIQKNAFANEAQLLATIMHEVTHAVTRYETV